jgi:hypothetical protein
VRVDEVIRYSARNVATRRGVPDVLGTVDLAPTTDRFVATTCGTGLLDVAPAEAYRLTGSANPVRTVRIFLAVLIGVPVLISVIMIVLLATGYPR